MPGKCGCGRLKDVVCAEDLINILELERVNVTVITY